MRASVRVQPLRQINEVIIREMMSPEAGARIVADFAREQLREAQEANRGALGYEPPHETYVNGNASDRLEAVQPGKSIVFRFQLIQELLLYIDAQLREHSPVRRGTYQQSHEFFADDVGADVNAPPPAKQYVFLSSVPYSRKIERGLSKQAPDGVYEAVATLAERRYSALAQHVRFGYRSYPGGGIGKWAQSASADALARRIRKGSPSLHEEWLTRQPAVIVTV